MLIEIYFINSKLFYKIHHRENKHQNLQKWPISATFGFVFSNSTFTKLFYKIKIFDLLKQELILFIK
jgi:hypothetical protein